MDRSVRAAPLLAVPFAFGAIHHVVAVVSRAAGDASSPTRHVVFVAINLFFGVAFAIRARWVIFPALFLIIQQTYSHGGAFLEARRAGSFDAESFAVLCFLPVIALVAIALARTPALERLARMACPKCASVVGAEAASEIQREWQEQTKKAHAHAREHNLRIRIESRWRFRCHACSAALEFDPSTIRLVTDDSGLTGSYDGVC